MAQLIKSLCKLWYLFCKNLYILSIHFFQRISSTAQNATYILTHEQRFWTIGPRLNQPRSYVGCGMIWTNRKQNQKGAFVVGGQGIFTAIVNLLNNLT